MGTGIKFQVGVIGATGFIGAPYRREMREARDKFEIVALCARRREPLEAAAKEDGCGFITDEWRKVVDSPAVDLLMVATPDRLHHEAVMAGISAGKHIFCEKPVGADSRQAYEMWRACREAGLAHYVPFWSRYMAPFLRAREIVQAGILGEIKVIMYRWHNPRPASMPFTWRDDASLSAAGSIADVGSHAYDSVRWIVGAEATRVLAHAGVITPPKPDLGNVNLGEALEWGLAHAAAGSEKVRKGSAFDYATVAWEFETGAVGAITLSHAPYLRKGLAPELELHGTEASLSLDRERNTISVTRPGQKLPDIEELPQAGPENRFARYVYPALAERVSGGESAQPGLEDGYRVQIFTDAAALSARRGTWVETSELERPIPSRK